MPHFVKHGDTYAVRELRRGRYLSGRCDTPQQPCRCPSHPCHRWLKSDGASRKLSSLVRGLHIWRICGYSMLDSYPVAGRTGCRLARNLILHLARHCDAKRDPDLP